MDSIISIWKDDVVSGSHVGHAVVDGSGGMKLIVLIRPPGKKAVAHAFHLPTGEPVGRRTGTLKADIEEAIRLFSE